jgi:phytanoyl-CoA hydroxylase
MNDESLKSRFDDDGFVVVQQFLPQEELQQLQSELDRYICDIVPHLPGSDAFYHDRDRPETLKQMQHMGNDAFFNEYRRNSRWAQLAAQLLGEAAQSKGPEWFNKPPGTEYATPPHQDNFYFCLRPPSVLTMWLALDVVDAENGCLRYVAGSHKPGIRPHGPTDILGFSQGISDYSSADRDAEVAVSLQPGDVAVHLGNTIHRADSNASSNRNRRAFAMVFEGESCQRDADAYARYEVALEQQHSRMGLAGA